MNLPQRRKAIPVRIGTVTIGGNSPVAVQSMTDTPTSDIPATARQTIDLIEAGSEMVRWTVNDDRAAQAVPEIIRILRGKGYSAPIIGDFHFNGHILLERHPQMAQALAKYRINPGNIGKGKQHDKNFAAFINAAKEHDKPVRIGVNWGSLDEEVFTKLMNTNSRRRQPKSFEQLTCQAMVESALRSADYALKLGLKPNKIVLSVKMSRVQDMVRAYEQLAQKCDFALHLGLTEAGADAQGIIASSAALAILLQKEIGDTIRVSLTPHPGVSRSKEVEVCKNLLQALGRRYFSPTITSCPGCGRTDRESFQKLSAKIREYILAKTPSWRKKYPGIEQLKIAVMGCVVNGPGESRHADIGISLPGASESLQAPVYIAGKKAIVLKGKNIAEQFIKILEEYIRKTFNTDPLRRAKNNQKE